MLPIVVKTTILPVLTKSGTEKSDELSQLAGKLHDFVNWVSVDVLKNFCSNTTLHGCDSKSGSLRVSAVEPGQFQLQIFD